MALFTERTQLAILQLTLLDAKRDWSRRWPTVTWNVRPDSRARDRDERNKARERIFALEREVQRIKGGQTKNEA